MRISKTDRKSKVGMRETYFETVYISIKASFDFGLHCAEIHWIPNDVVITWNLSQVDWSSKDGIGISSDLKMEMKKRTIRDAAQH